MTIRSNPDATTVTRSSPRSQRVGEPRRIGLSRWAPRMLSVAALYFVLEILAKLLVVVQLVFIIATGTPNPGVSRFAEGLAQWMAGFWSFVTFARVLAPWPFTPWPRPSQPDVPDP